MNIDEILQDEVPVPPPNDEQAERAIVATMLVDELARSQALALVRPEHFFGRATRTVFEALLAMHAASEPIDGVTVLTRLRETGRLGDLGPGGIPEVIDCAAVGNVAAYARAVRDAWRMRRLIAEAQRWAAMAVQARGGDASAGRAYAPAQGVLEAVVATANDLASDTHVVTSQTGVEVMRDVCDFVDRQGELLKSRGIAGVSTGLGSLDRMTSGLHGPDLTLLGALPSMGKTALLMAIAMGAAESGVGVAFFSLEMSSRDIALRAVCARAGVTMMEVRSGAYLSRERGAALVKAMTDVARLPIVWDGLSSKNPSATVPTALELMAKSERAAAQAKGRREPIGLVVVDYLQRVRMVPGRHRTREEAVADTTKSLKLLAVRLGVPVLVAAALNRQSASEGRKPAMYDLRESGAAEYEADAIWLLHRDDYKHERASSRGGPAPVALTREAEVIIAKSRNGATGCVTLGFDREFTRFRDIESESAPTHWNDEERERGDA